MRELEKVKECVDELVESDEAERAIGLYEIFLSGCHQKAEETDDSDGALGDFFQELFLSWIKARQQAGHEASETVRQILKWKENDEYGFCYDIEGDIATTLNETAYPLFAEHFQEQIERALEPIKNEERRNIDDYPAEAFLPVKALKSIYLTKQDLKSYQALCERFVLSPKDCENIAALHQEKRRYGQALAWVDKGLAAEKTRRWGNEAAYALSEMRRELLAKTGRKKEAFNHVWNEFKRHPSLFGYTELTKLAPEKDRRAWHEKAIDAARKTSLEAFIEICVKTKEIDALSRHIDSIKDDQLEDITHYVTEKAAKALTKKHPQSAMTIYRALGMRILRSGKSKYYSQALEHFGQVKKLSKKAGYPERWEELVQTIHDQHLRKRGFIDRFEDLVVTREAKPSKSFEENARATWKKKTS